MEVQILFLIMPKVELVGKGRALQSLTNIPAFTPES